MVTDPGPTGEPARAQGIRGWLSEERRPNGSRWKLAVTFLLRLISDPVIWVVTFGPIIAQSTVALVGTNTRLVSPAVTNLAVDPVFCGLLSYATAVFVAFVSWAFLLFGFIRGGYLWFTMFSATATSGRYARFALFLAFALLIFLIGIVLFAWGGAGNEVMLYQSGDCFRPGSGAFQAPPLASLITWLRGMMLLYVLVNIFVGLSPATWMESDNGDLDAKASSVRGPRRRRADPPSNQ